MMLETGKVGRSQCQYYKGPSSKISVLPPSSGVTPYTGYLTFLNVTVFIDKMGVLIESTAQGHWRIKTNIILNVNVIEKIFLKVTGGLNEIIIHIKDLVQNVWFTVNTQ